MHVVGTNVKGSFAKASCRKVAACRYQCNIPQTGRGVLGPVGSDEKETKKRAIFADLQARGFTLCYRWRATAMHPLFANHTCAPTAASNNSAVGAASEACKAQVLPAHKALEEALLLAFDYPANKTNNVAYRFDFKITHEDWLLEGQFPILLE